MNLTFYNVDKLEANKDGQFLIKGDKLKMEKLVPTDGSARADSAVATTESVNNEPGKLYG